MDKRSHNNLDVSAPQKRDACTGSDSPTETDAIVKGEVESEEDVDAVPFAVANQRKDDWGGGDGDEVGGCNGSASIERRKRRMVETEELAELDAELFEKFGKPLDTLTKEQLKMLLCRACVQYPAVERALYTMIEADPSSRRLMIRNISYATTEKTLKAALDEYGEIDDFKLVMEKDSSANKGFAFVTYAKLESVSRLMAGEITVNGRHLSVKLASQQDPANALKRTFLGPHQSCRLFVRNVPDSCDDVRLKNEFSSFGQIKEAVIIRNREGKSRGFGFVVFKEPEALLKATCQSQRVIDGQVTFVSIAEQGGKKCSHGEGPQNHETPPRQQPIIPAAPWPPPSPSPPRSSNAPVIPCSPPTAGASLAGPPPAPPGGVYPHGLAASLYAHHYQQQYITSSQGNSGVCTSNSNSASHPPNYRYPNGQQRSY